MSVRAALGLQMAASSLYKSDANSSLGKHVCVCARMHTGPERETQVRVHTHMHIGPGRETQVCACACTQAQRGRHKAIVRRDRKRGGQNREIGGKR